MTTFTLILIGMAIGECLISVALLGILLRT